MVNDSSGLAVWWNWSKQEQTVNQYFPFFSLALHRLRNPTQVIQVGR